MSYARGMSTTIVATHERVDDMPAIIVHLLGHSKDHRPDLPQVQVSMAVLDPLGLPLTTTVVAGQTADDPLYLPEIAKVRPVTTTTGLAYVGDCKMAALGTRAEIVAHQDYYLCPLSAKQMPDTELDRVLDPVLRDVLAPSAIRLPKADGALDEPDEPVAMGLAYTVDLSASDQSGESLRGKSAVWSCARWPSP